MRFLVKYKGALYFLPVIIVFGYLIGKDINDDFLNLCLSKFTLIPVRYLMLLIMVSVNYLVFYYHTKITHIVRYKNLINLYKKIVIDINVVNFILVFILVIIIFVLNLPKSIEFFQSGILLLLNILLISNIANSIIQLVDIYVCNRKNTIIIVIVSFAILDFVWEQMYFFKFIVVGFKFDQIFIIFNYTNNYIFIFMIAITLLIVTNILALYIVAKKDCLFKGNINEL